MPRNLLVVDDSATIRDAVSYALAGEDWVVLTASDTSEALDAVRANAIDAVLCDAFMVPDDGYEACRTLRSAMGDDPVPIVMMGGKVSENLAASAGATAVMAKPFASEELLEVLRESLERGSFDLAADDFTPLDGEDEEEIMSDLTPAAAETGPTTDEEVEIIDLSEDDEGEELELLQGLEPLVVASGDVVGDAVPSSQPWDEEGMGLSPGLHETREVEEAEEDLSPTGPMEFDLVDLGGEEDVGGPPETLDFAEPSAAAESGTEDMEGEEFADFDLQGLDLNLMLDSEPPEAVRGEGAPPEPDSETVETGDFATAAGTDDLLGDIDLEGWAEESLPAGEESTPTVETAMELSWTEPPDSAPDRAGSDHAEAPEPDLLADREEPEEETFEEEVIEEPPQIEEETFPEAVPPASEAPGAVEIAEAVQEGPSLEEYGAGDELPIETPSPEPEADATWAEPGPTPTVEVAWDQQLPQEDALAEPVARAAEQAVRQALTESLSPQALTPVVEAVVERVVWEVVPQLAERLICEAIERLKQEPGEE